MFNLIKSLTKTQAATASLHDLLDQARQAVSDAKDRLAAIASAPQDAETAVASFEAWLDRAAADAMDRLGLHHATEPGWSGPTLPSVAVRVGEGMARDSTASCEILLGLIALIGRDKLLHTVSGQIGDRMAGVVGLTAATRAKRVTEAEFSILEAELVEERIVRAMELAGVAVSRRAGVDPRALLASDSSLPS